MAAHDVTDLPYVGEAALPEYKEMTRHEALQQPLGEHARMGPNILPLVPRRTVGEGEGGAPSDEFFHERFKFWVDVGLLLYQINEHSQHVSAKSSTPCIVSSQDSYTVRDFNILFCHCRNDPTRAESWWQNFFSYIVTSMGRDVVPLVKAIQYLNGPNDFTRTRDILLKTVRPHKLWTLNELTHVTPTGRLATGRSTRMPA